MYFLKDTNEKKNVMVIMTSTFVPDSRAFIDRHPKTLSTFSYIPYSSVKLTVFTNANLPPLLKRST